jgi:hypothetical protein
LTTHYRTCLQWINRVTLTVGRPLPVYPDQQTFLVFVEHVSNAPEAAIEPDLRLALAKPRFRGLRFT